LPFEVTILGCSSATPTADRHPSAQFLQIRNSTFLIDCGEGTQIQIMRFRLRTHKLQHIFISHLHPDHYLGLLGLLCTFNLQGRNTPLTIFSPPGLQEVIYKVFNTSGVVLQYELVFEIVNTSQPEIILETPEVLVQTLILQHRIPTVGYLFREQPTLLKIDAAKAALFKLPFEAFKYFKRGEDFVDESGQRFSYKDFTFPPPAPRSFAYVSDTIYTEEILPFIFETDLLYHEATFMHDRLDRAKETFHTTSVQAAELAKKANVKQLLLGHFSARYKNLEPLLEEAREVFPDTALALEGLKFTV
jgi:ribonuclease Z